MVVLLGFWFKIDGNNNILNIGLGILVVVNLSLIWFFCNFNFFVVGCGFGCLFLFNFFESVIISMLSIV